MAASFLKGLRDVAAAVVQQTTPGGDEGGDPEYSAALQAEQRVERHAADLLAVCEHSRQRGAGGLLLGNEAFAEALGRWVTDEQQQRPLGEDETTFVAALAQFCALQRELRQQRKELDDAVDDLLIAPLRSFLAHDAARVQAAAKRADRAKRAHDAARTRAETLERIGAAASAAEAARLLAAEADLDAARRAHAEAAAAAATAAREAAMRKDFTLLSDVRLTMLRQLQHFRYCAQVLEASAPLVAELDAFTKRRAEEFAAAREQRRAAEDAAAAEYERTGRYAPLLALLADQQTLETLLAAAAAAPDMGGGEVTEQLVASAARALDAQPGQPALRIIRRQLTATVESDTGSSSTPGAVESNALFALRGSNPATRFLSTYCRLHTSRWLSAVIHDAVAAATEHPELCEIDPSKMRLPEEQQAMNAVAEHATNLAAHCTTLLDSVQSRVAECPVQVREICRHMRECIAAKRGEQAGDLAVGGLLFLRLVCPAVMHARAISPEDGQDGASKMRALVLIAKTLQAIAGEGTELKESYMRPMQEYVLETRPRLHAIYDAFCAVSEAEVVAAPPIASAENVQLSDLPLIGEIVRTHFAAFARQLSDPLHRPLLIKLAKVLATH